MTGYAQEGDTFSRLWEKSLPPGEAPEASDETSRMREILLMPDHFL
jgi:hypothetical protein